MEKGGEKRSGTGEDGIGRLFNIITNLLKEKDILYFLFGQEKQTTWYSIY
jgi:hypothetical protein